MILAVKIVYLPWNARIVVSSFARPKKTRA